MLGLMSNAKHAQEQLLKQNQFHIATKNLQLSIITSVWYTCSPLTTLP